MTNSIKISLGILILNCCILLGIENINAQQWQSKLVQVDKKGNITYHPEENGYIMPDFSAAGYRGGGVALPEVKVVHTISAIEGDNTAHIQEAIDKVGAMPLNNAGIRGALLLKAGLYKVSGSIHLKYSGVVLRGEGQGDNPATSTIIFGTGNTPHQRTLVFAGNRQSSNNWRTAIGSRVNIEDDYLPAGSNTFKISSVDAFKTGDQIILTHPATQKWIDAIGGGVGESRADPWEVSDRYNIVYNRYITAVNPTNKTVTLDAPLFYGFKKELSQSYMYKLNQSNILKEIGVENLCIESDFNQNVKLKYKIIGEYYADENHVWNGLHYTSVENGWAKDVTVKSVGLSSFQFSNTTRCTVLDCSAIDPVSKIEGGRRYGFNTAANSQLILFNNCYARNSRHGFVSNGTTTSSGNVFLYCKSESAFAASEGHRQWSSGFLFDNYQEVSYNNTYKHTLAFYNRGSYGTSHGWSMVSGVAWNCDLTAGTPDKGHLIVQKPPTGQNFAIGCMASEINGKGPFKGPEGYIEGINKPGLFPESLYEAQLNARLKNQKK
jgi:hypothetical protein